MPRPVALVLSLACAVCGGGRFVCQDDDDCRGGEAPGMCSVGGACSFPDAACESGQRYGEHGGALSGQCVPPADGTSSGTTAGSTSTVTSDGTSTTITTTSPPGTTSTGELTTTPVSDTTLGESSTGPEPLDPDLLVWLRFGEGGAPGGGVTNDGGLGGVATCVDDCPSVLAGAASYDGVDDCLAFPSDATLVDQPFTAAAWVWPTDGTRWLVLLGKALAGSTDNSWEVYLRYAQKAGQTFGFEMSVSTVVAGPPPVLDAWNHVAASWDGETMALFVDGELVGETPYGAPMFDEHELRFGCDDDDGTAAFFFAGWFADVRIYGRALQPADVAALAGDVPADPNP